MRTSPAIRGCLPILSVACAALLQTTRAQPIDPAVVGERIQRLTAAVESLELSFASQKRQIENLGNELHKLREEMVRQSENQRLANPRPWADDVKRLADAISEVDRKRASDGEQVVRVLNDLKKAVAASTEVPKPSRVGTSPRPGTSSRGSAAGSANADSSASADKGGGKPTEKPPDKTLEYVLERGQRLSDVIVSFNEEAKKQGYQTLTVSQVMKFNNIKDDKKIREGTKLQLPVIPVR